MISKPKPRRSASLAIPLNSGENWFTAVDHDFHGAVKSYCHKRGIRIGQFIRAVVEDAMAKGATVKVEKRLTMALEKP